MQENLNEMIKTLNSGPIINSEVETTDVSAPPETSPISEPTKEPEKKVDDTIEIALINFYDWYESNADVIHNVSRVKAEVSNISPKDSMIFKIPQYKSVVYVDEQFVQIVIDNRLRGAHFIDPTDEMWFLKPPEESGIVT